MSHSLCESIGSGGHSLNLRKHPQSIVYGNRYSCGRIPFNHTDLIELLGTVSSDKGETQTTVRIKKFPDGYEDEIADFITFDLEPYKKYFNVEMAGHQEFKEIQYRMGVCNSSIDVINADRFIIVNITAVKESCHSFQHLVGDIYYKYCEYNDTEILDVDGKYTITYDKKQGYVKSIGDYVKLNVKHATKGIKALEKERNVRFRTAPVGWNDDEELELQDDPQKCFLMRN